jgi:hypothetical protein
MQTADIDPAGNAKDDPGLHRTAGRRFDYRHRPVGRLAELQPEAGAGLAAVTVPADRPALAK